MEYQHLVRDFAQRTRHNLAALRECQRKGREVYEVTQLINSMLGLLVLPQQRYYQSIPQTPLSELREAGWPEPLLSGDFDPPANLRELMRLLRNSIAHFNIEFTDTGGQIDGVRVWNTNQGRRSWQAVLSLNDLEQITERFIALILEVK